MNYNKLYYDVDVKDFSYECFYKIIEELNKEIEELKLKKATYIKFYETTENYEYRVMIQNYINTWTGDVIRKEKLVKLLEQRIELQHCIDCIDKLISSSDDVNFTEELKQQYINFYTVKRKKIANELYNRSTNKKY